LDANSASSRSRSTAPVPWPTRLPLSPRSNPRRHHRGVEADVVEPSAGVVVVADEPEVRLFGARDAVGANGEPFRVGADERREGPDGRGEPGGEDDVIERLLATASEERAPLGQLQNSGTNGDAAGADLIHEMEADERDGVERTMRGTRQHRRAVPLLRHDPH